MSGDDSNNTTTKLIFDVDPIISYEGPWTLTSTTVLVNNNEQPQTEHSTSTNGSTISLSFNGTQIDVIGAVPIGQGPLIANYTIDNAEPQTRSVEIISESQNASINFVTFFESAILDEGEHSIVIDVLGTGVDRNYTFQNFQVSVPANGNVTARGKSPSITAIVGGVLGGVVFILSLSLAFLHFRLRKSRSALRKYDCEKVESWSEVVATRQDRSIHLESTAIRETLSNMQPVNDTSKIVPFIISPQESANIAQTSQKLKEQHRGSHLITSVSTLDSTGLPSYSFASAQSRVEPQNSGTPSSVGASYTESFKRLDPKSMHMS